MTVPRPQLPEYGSPFVGRAAELERLAEAVAAGRQLIALVGPGGVGKTRLAVQYARTLPHLAADPPAGPVWFCDLTAAQSAADVCGAVSRALRMPFDAGPPTADAASRIGHWLRGCGPAVLILTGFERAARHASFTVGVWHATAPEVVFLVASREPLRLPHEVRVDVLPLAPPLVDAEAAVASGRNDAARVFLAAAPPDSVDVARPADARLVAEIVRRLRGVPLALEIAAGALRDASLAELATAVSAPAPPAPAAPGPSALVRETDADRAVKCAVEFACEKLPAAERGLLLGGSLFVGGFTPAAAAAVVPGAREDDVGMLAASAESLVARGLLHRGGDGDDGPRYAFWPAVREVAVRRLAEGGAREACEERFARYFLERGDAWAESAEGPDGAAALERLATEHDNLRAVLRAALAAERPDEPSALAALRAARALSPVLATRGTLASQLAALDEVVQAAGVLAPVRETALFASVLLLRGEALLHRGRTDDAAADGERALALGASTGHAVLAARATELLAAVAQQRGELAQAVTLTREAVERYRGLGERTRAGRARSSLGALCVDAGDAEGGEALVREALAEQRASGDGPGAATTLARLGELALARGDLASAMALLSEAADGHRAAGARRSEAGALGALARAQHLAGQLPNARRGYRLAAGTMREFGDRRLEGSCRAHLAMLDLEEKKLDAAARGLREALGLLRTVRDAGLEAMVLGASALQHAARGGQEESEALLEQCREALERAGDRGAGALAQLWRAACDATEAERLRCAGDDAAANGLLARARERAAGAAGGTGNLGPLALRVFRRYADAAAPPWRVDEAGRWFEPPERARVDLSTRPERARVFAALVRARAERPGEPVSTPDLAHAAFPTGGAPSRARCNRARLEARALRRAGLSPLLRERDGGFLLDHRANVRVAPAAD